MALVEGQNLSKSREEIFAELVEDFQSFVPDVYTGEEGNLMLLFQTFSGGFEAVYMALQVANEDMFVKTANPAALEAHGDERDLPRHIGTFAIGEIQVTGNGGTPIPINSEAAYDPGTGDDLLYFTTTENITLPNPGIPVAPAVAASGGAGSGVLTGTYEYVVTFVTDGGETIPGTESLPVVVNTQKVNVTAIPLGGPGTTKRRLYRQKNGDGIYKLVTEIADNVTNVYLDNILDAGLGGNPPAISSAETASIEVKALSTGAKYNLLANYINTVVDMPSGVNTVRNAAPMTGGSDEEELEHFRARLLEAIQTPGDGSPGDLKSLAETVAGVDTATVFENDNLGVPTNGHTTVRISGPGGSIPSAGVQADVFTLLDALDYANITLHVGTFTAVPTDVTVTVTPSTEFTLLQVTPGVQQAIVNYINSLNVGQTLRVSGIVDAVFGLAGVEDVVVTTPGGNLATAATSKRTPNNIVVA